MTKDGLLCLGGRLQKSNFNFYEKHPLILPSKSRFSELLIMKEHQRLYHAGVCETLTQIRETNWILCGRQTVKSCLKKMSYLPEVQSSTWEPDNCSIARK
ncbi:integrase catalytic domain-containing protein [Trichonephila inaurata madagascariensis]|uniref:Integrase catalytic domain-containing protein n=1 Tax=Trichonephila inaurata madagascariensis TaxID=2747483 RepID=A0A8X6XEU9_9ARAC|nr:integrase catalytic domain-containing protein [Trichonephila inaurata madagascariensis]